MTDREKVIKGLECCLPMTTRNGLGDCENCPYDREITLEGGITECCHELMLEAHALLKALEPRMPRVMTLEELVRDNVVYLEDFDKESTVPGIYCDGHDEERVFATKMNGYLFVKDDDYGVRWRCWTSPPDEKRRAETPWEQ